MTLKTPEQWARDWSLPGIGGMVEAVRAEFAVECAAKFQAHFGVTTKSKAHNTAVLACCNAVESLARPATEHKHTPLWDAGAGCYWCKGCGILPMQEELPMCACGIPAGKGHRDGCPTQQPAACKHEYISNRDGRHCMDCDADL